MAIKTQEVTIESGPDAGKVFVVHQMALLRGDNWGNRAAMAIAKAGIDLDGINIDGLSVGVIDFRGIAEVALKALGGLDNEVTEGLLAELMNVVRVKLADGTLRTPIIDDGDSYIASDTPTGDITDINTLWKIRIAALKVNLDFLTKGVIQ